MRGLAPMLRRPVLGAAGPGASEPDAEVRRLLPAEPPLVAATERGLPALLARREALPLPLPVTCGVLAAAAA